MNPRTPSPRKRVFRTAGGRDAAGLPPPPLFQVPEGQSNFDETTLNYNDLRLHRKGPSKPSSRYPKGWNESVESWEERYVRSPTSFPHSPSAFYSPAPSMMTATTAPMTATPTEVDISVYSSTTQNNPYFIPITTLSPDAVPYCQPMSPPPAYLSTLHANSRHGSRASTPTSHHNSTSNYEYNNNSNNSNNSNNANANPPGFSTPRRSPTKQRRAPNSASSVGSAMDDPNRKQRIKTELCMHHRRGNDCPFGEKCTYAHGEEELQLTRLMDMQRAGLIEDAETYRTKPCWTYVATGSCPFGRRCGSIHDPRTTGTVSSWLPHTETQGNSMSTDINVDGLHQKRLHSIQYGNPFGDQFSIELDDFADLYKLICNNTSSNKRRRNNLSEIHKLSMALQMRGEAGWMYKYRPQHFIRGTLCMVLQKRAFRLEKSGTALPIPLNKYKAEHSGHILVRELAFGPDSDPSVRGVALYFNIPKEDVSECTPQQAKRYRWKKSSGARENNRDKLSIFDKQECFVMIRPFEKDPFDLATRILQHRFDTVKAERLSALKQRFAVMKKLTKEKEDLRDTFHIHKKDWIKWSWPVCFGRQNVDEDTCVPSVEAEYIPIVDSGAIMDDDAGSEAIKGSAIQPLWESFVAQVNKFEEQVGEIDDAPRVKKNLFSSLDDLAPRTDGTSRLVIFKRLASGYQVCQNRSLPHIKSATKDAVENQILGRQSERCWKALLLKKHDNEFAKNGNEWEVVQGHFQKSRSNKVLKIIQD
ncbi:unnamed protein product [Cylindrotheca closterium]|uniref:C3H1-type domain-containing protein n=1 Tax=Cylindrotheca closterium TaxID=2856 RepID=A0AAD2FLS3_9STRA|nr:unnamed protein product [Cylindrotheca closterium]